MNATTIVGYAYDAALHCVDCTRAAADVGLLKREPPLKLDTDEHGIALDLIDRESNPISRVFCGEDSHGECCDDCGESLDGSTAIRCDQCEFLPINGIGCHEAGCPNAGARWDSESESWIKQRECFECGCTVDKDGECCDSEPEEELEPTFEIVDLGVHHPDYFQGFGTSFTKFEHCTYGIGDTTQEAYDSALDSAAQFSPWAAIDLDTIPNECPFQYSVDDSGHGDEAEGPYCHVGIRWNTVKGA